MLGVYGKEIYLPISQYVLEGQGCSGDFSKNKRAGWHHFPPTHQPTYTEKSGNRLNTKILHLLANSMSHPHALVQIRPLQPCQESAEFSQTATGSLSKQTSRGLVGTARHSWGLLLTLSPICPWPQHIQSTATSHAVCKQCQQGPAPLQNDF